MGIYRERVRVPNRLLLQLQAPARVVCDGITYATSRLTGTGGDGLANRVEATKSSCCSAGTRGAAWTEANGIGANSVHAARAAASALILAEITTRACACLVDRSIRFKAVARMVHT